MFPDKPFPDTVNCWMLGLTEALPAHPDIVPVAALAVIPGGDEFTVIVNVTGEHTAPFVIKLPPNEAGLVPVVKVVNKLLFEVFITETLFAR